MGAEKSKMDKEKEFDQFKNDLLKMAFVSFDKNGDGFLDHNEIKNLAIQRGIATKSSFESAYATYMKKYDTNKDGKLNIKEFFTFCKAEMIK